MSEIQGQVVQEGDTQDWGLGQKGQPQGTEQHPSAPGRLLGKPFQCRLAGEREQPQRGLGTVLAGGGGVLTVWPGRVAVGGYGG